MGGFLCFHIRIETSQKPQFPQCIQCLCRQELDFLWPLLEPIAFGVGDDGIEMRPFLRLLGKEVSFLGEFQAPDLDGRKGNLIQRSILAGWSNLLGNLQFGGRLLGSKAYVGMARRGDRNAGLRELRHHNFLVSGYPAAS